MAGLDRDRYTVDIASGPGVQEERAREIADQVHILHNLRRPLLDPGAAATFTQLAALSANYDVVHTHGSKAGVLGRLAARMRHVPAIVHTVHGMPVNDYMSVAQRRVLLAAERAAARCSDSIICVCEENMREALALKSSGWWSAASRRAPSWTGTGPGCAPSSGSPRTRRSSARSPG